MPAAVFVKEKFARIGNDPKWFDHPEVVHPDRS